MGIASLSTSSLLLPVTRGGSQTMMTWWDGAGAGRVLAHDTDAVLLERTGGARSLSDLARGGEDEAATHVMCDV